MKRVIVLLMLVAAGIVSAGNQIDVAKCRECAEKGNPKAQFYLGMCYSNGEGVEKDGTEAVKWYRRAAAQGHPAARKCLAELGVAWELDPLAPLGLSPGVSAEKLTTHDDSGEYLCLQCEADKTTRTVYAVSVATREPFSYTEAFSRFQAHAKDFMPRFKSKPEVSVNKCAWRETVNGHAYKYELGVKEADDVKGKWFVVYGVFDLTLGKEVQARLLRGDAEKLALTFRKSDGTKVTVPVKQALDAKEKPYPVK